MKDDLPTDESDEPDVVEEGDVQVEVDNVQNEVDVVEDGMEVDDVVDGPVHEDDEVNNVQCVVNRE